MNFAAEQLRNPKLLVKEAAANVGFQDPFHFSHAFKKVLGTSPEVFRRLQSFSSECGLSTSAAPAVGRQTPSQPAVHMKWFETPWAYSSRWGRQIGIGMQHCVHDRHVGRLAQTVGVENEGILSEAPGAAIIKPPERNAIN